MDASKELDLLIRSRYPIIYFRTSEESRACNLLRNIAKAQRKNLLEWTTTEGMKTVETYHGGTIRPTPDMRHPSGALEAILQDSGRTIYVMKDLYAYLDDRAVVRRLRDLYESIKRSYKTMVILAPVKKIPPQLEKAVYYIELPLPDIGMLKRLLQDIVGTVRQDKRIKIDLSETQYESMANAALGLSLEEAERVFFKAIIRDARLSADDVHYIRDEKRQIVQKSGLLEYYETTESLKSVGGLDLLKAWLKRRTRAFDPSAREYGLPSPKGLLLLGVQGCGKSLAAKAVSGSWGFPLLRLDLSRIFGHLMGSSEENMRRALEMAAAVSPAVLWVDEIEKTFSGVEGSGTTDAGTTARVFGSFLTWLQDKKETVFCVATANSVSRLPPELLRKGRFDEIFFVDLPGLGERADIFTIHLKKRRRDPARFKLDRLAEATDGYSGAEIEQAILSAMYDAFDQHRDITTTDILQAVQSSVPLSVTMREELSRLRQWARDRARPASS
jgi:SpoVK/Ycf46/Vps4 family AAA+-type ATPase